MNISPKVGASTTAGAATILLVWILSMCGVTVPAEASAAITTVLSAAAGYLAKDRLRDFGADLASEAPAPKHAASE